MINSTLIGSLPYLTTKQAIESLSTVSLPVYPALIKLDQNELMIDFLDSYIEHRRLPSQFDYFVNHLKDHYKQFAFHVCGPITHRKYSKNKINAKQYHHAYEDLFSLFEPEKTILFLDEPGLLDEVIELKDFISHFPHYTFGIHSCGKFDWIKLTQALSQDIKFLSYDCLVFESKKSTGNSIIPIHGYDVLTNRLNLDFDDEEWISPSCGLGFMQETEAQMVIRKMSELS